MHSMKYKELQRDCLLREYESRQKQARQLEKSLSSLTCCLEKDLSTIDYLNLKKFYYDVACRIHSNVMPVHQRKLEKLNGGPIGQNYEEMKSKTVHNVSSYTLSSTEERLLCRGWDFCIENKVIDFLEFGTDVELNSLRIESSCHNSVFRSICRHMHNASQQLMKSCRKKKFSNLSDDELKALKSLKSNKNIVIVKADKGNSIIILDKESYIKKAEEILKGNQFQEITNKNYHQERENELNKYIYSLLKDGIIDQKLRFRLQSTCSSLSVFYGLPKIHKTGYPIRPIISTIGSFQYELSKYLAKAIKDSSPQADSDIKDSFEFVKKIKNTILSQEKSYIICSFDVESLYTNVPVEEAINVTLDFIFKLKQKNANIPFSREQMKKLLELSVRDAPFRFQNKIYKQIDGVAMGSPLTPILANLWLQKIEQKLNKFSKNRPVIWLRYVDDIFCLFDISEIKVLEFHSKINKWHKNLKFTIAMEPDNTIPFLDVLVTIDDVHNQLTTSLYRKPTHTGLYLLWDSSQSRRYKIGLIKTLVIRIYRICSTKEIIQKEINQLKETLENNGYPQHIIKRGISEGEIIIRKEIKAQIKAINKNANNNIIYFTIAYYGQESLVFAARVKRICKKLAPNLNIQFAFRKHLSLKRIFLPILKGKDESKEKKNLIYSIPCSNCEKVYIGETSRMRETRMAEHRSKIKTLASDSKLVEHIEQHKHKFDFSKVETLARETDWRKRTIKESILTNKACGNAINDTKHILRVVS
ncbi:unnamed protein product [Rotaria socialis]|uniref:Reverse transcriptase domain-containing protein n=1 Tax=Rotaria socialis TaxID=392032 RepID=A0A817LN19_9BILA|nr:unnamed protein product [Rotaria socialis]CAF4521852.1 unnamed protein product [Rotaria socialis]